MTHARSVRPYGRQAQRDEGSHLKALLVGVRADQLERLVRDLGDAHLFDVELHLSGLDLRQIEEAIDETEEVVRGLSHTEEIGLLLRRHLAVEAVQHELRVADDRVHGCPELVADRREELALEPVGALELQVVDPELGDEVRVLVRDGDQTRDRSQRARLRVSDFALLPKVGREEADGASPRGERNVRDELQVAGLHAREPDAIGVGLRADEDAHRERDRGLGVEPHGRGCRETPT